MEGGIDGDACLDYATIQIFPSKNRYEIFICGDDEVEKLAVGKLEQLLPHLPGVNNLNAKGSNAIFKLQVIGGSNTAPWFTKSTLNRFLQVVGPSDLVNTSKTIEGEMAQLEEARKFHLSLYAQGKQNNSEGGETDGSNSIGMEMESTTQAEVKIASSDTSKNELLQAMDLRLTALRSELVAALNQTVGATCSSKEIMHLINFCEHFGATDLKNSLCKILELSQKSVAADDKCSSTCVAKVDKDAQTSRPVYSAPPVKYGVSPSKVAQVERWSSTESEESSESSDENNVSAERSRALTRAATPRRSASPMRRIQIGRTGSRRAAALTIKSLNYYPGRERASERDPAASSSEDEGPERPVNKLENNVRRMSVQDAINLFEKKQKDQTTDVQKKSSSLNISLSANKSVLRRWSSGIAERSTPVEQELASEEAVPIPCKDSGDREVSENIAEEKLDSDFTDGCQIPVESTKVDVVSERCEKSAQDPVEIETETNATQGLERDGKLTASMEWGRQKELELNQMLMKMMESQPMRTRKPQTNTDHDIPSEKRGGFYNHYKEKRDKKLRGENAEKKAEKEAQFRAMQKTLDKRKAEMVSTNAKDAGRKIPSPKSQKPLNNPPQPANPRSGSVKTSGTRKVSSKPSPLPATRKSWPSTPSTRPAVSSPSKTPTAVSSAGNTPTNRKPQSLPSQTRSSAKLEKPQPRVRNLKEAKADIQRSLQGVKEIKRQTMPKSGKSSKTKAATVSGDDSAKALSKPSLYNKMTKKSSVVPLESKPFLRKGSGTSPAVGPTVNKTKHSSQLGASSVNCESKRETQENEVVVDTANLVSEHHDQDIVPVLRVEAEIESERLVDSFQGCGEDNFDKLSPGDDGGFKDAGERSEDVQPQEESFISPTAWVEVEEQEDLSNAYNDGTSQQNSPAHIAPVGLSSPYIRHSLSQMLQEDNNSDPDTVEWGNAENPPAVLYQKDAPKGFKRLLKFARKSKGDANLTGWSSPSVYSEGEDDSEESKAASKRNTDNLLRKAALHSRDYGHQSTSFLEAYEKKMNIHDILTAQSNTSKCNVQSSHKLNKDHGSTTASTTKASRSFFSLSAFRGSKPNETKFQ